MPAETHRQRDFRVRFDWGLSGADAIATGADVAVVVDVLSFTTTVSVALDLGVAVLPYRWRAASAAGFAREHDAVLAGARSSPGPSLSPAGLRALKHLPARLVLPSPNGSTISHRLGAAGGSCVAASLRNAGAVAAWIEQRGPRSVAVVAAGEQWPDAGLRPAVEDLWGAGAVLAGLIDLGWDDLSPEARSAAAAYADVRGRELTALRRCCSGAELIAAGHVGDVDIAAEVQASASVPVLRDGCFSHG